MKKKTKLYTTYKIQILEWNINIFFQIMGLVT